LFIHIENVQNHDFERIGGEQALIRAKESALVVEEGFGKYDALLQEVAMPEFVHVGEQLVGKHSALLLERNVHVEPVHVEF